MNIVSFSGGKDSTALILWAKENLPDFKTVFCDTGWEHPLTYAYIKEINETLLGESLITLKSEKFAGFAELVLQRQMFPQQRMRFCTQELKIFPLHKFIESVDEEVVLYQGIRADESGERAKMDGSCWLDDAGGYQVERPLLNWTAGQCFALMEKYGVKPNPLYLLGAKRVGCWPCIMVGKAELKNLFERTPGLIERLNELEARLNADREESDFRGFFRTDYIPPKHCSKQITKKDGKSFLAPTAQDVYDYIMWTDPSQIPLFDVPAPSCVSFYNLCE